ncbi:MAG: metal ABC transporter permease [Thermoplasmata archaeon]|nr:metal ABC transporter permease [Thermoplasmata archaeon]
MVDAATILSMFDYPFIQRAFIGGVCAALLCSILGVFMVLRRSSLIGEGIAHLSFGGIAVGLFFAIYPLFSALVLSLLGILAISYLQRKKIVYSETAIGILFSFGLALGAVLASVKGGFSIDLFSYLFGSILTVSTDDLILIIILTGVVLTFVGIFFKELMHMTFDEQGARLSEVPTIPLDIIFNVVVAFAVIVSIKIVGTLLVSSLLIIPAAASLQLSRSFKETVTISIIASMISVIAGLVLSFVYDVATGGAIVLVSLGIFVICVLGKRLIRSGELPKKATS